MWSFVRPPCASRNHLQPWSVVELLRLQLWPLQQIHNETDRQSALRLDKAQRQLRLQVTEMNWRLAFSVFCCKNVLVANLSKTSQQVVRFLASRFWHWSGSPVVFSVCCSLLEPPWSHSIKQCNFLFFLYFYSKQSTLQHFVFVLFFFTLMVVIVYLCNV